MGTIEPIARIALFEVPMGTQWLSVRIVGQSERPPAIMTAWVEDDKSYPQVIPKKSWIKRLWGRLRRQ
jgi:hypothetical protein